MDYDSYYNEFKDLGMHPSLSEKRFMNFLSDDVLHCYSVWISTWGFGEAIMAKENWNRKIVATTVDDDWYKFSEKLFEKIWVADQIELRLEDVSKKNDYPNEHFDIIYARLVLHYLGKTDLESALSELYRVLKKWSKFFLVVKSEKNIQDGICKKHAFDQETKMTTVHYLDTDGKITNSAKRFYHTLETISDAVSNAGFEIEGVGEYEEKLCKDYARKEPSLIFDKVIELVAVKK